MQRNLCRSGYGGVEKGLPEDWAMPNRPRCGHALLRTSVQNHFPCGWRWLVWRGPAGANAPGGMLPPGVAESSALQLQDCGSSTDLLRRLPYASGRVYPHRGKVIREFEVRHPDIEVTLVLYREGVYEMARRLLAQDKPDSTEADVGRSEPEPGKSPDRPSI